MRAELEADVSILKTRRVGGQTKPLTLTALRERLEDEERSGQPALFDRDDWGGCGCLTDFGSTA